MKRLLAATLVLTIVGCSEGLDSARLMDQPKTVSVAPPPNQIVPHIMSPRAEAPESASESKKTSLMKCMSEACRVMCSRAEAAKGSKPKWCTYFEEPI